MLGRTAPPAVNGARRLARQGVARLAGQARNRQTRRRALAHCSARPRIGDRMPLRSARPLTRPGARRRLALGSPRRSCQRARCGFDSGASLLRGRALGGVAIGRAGARKSTFPRCRSARGARRRRRSSRSRPRRACPATLREARPTRAAAFDCPRRPRSLPPKRAAPRGRATGRADVERAAFGFGARKLRASASSHAAVVVSSSGFR